MIRKRQPSFFSSIRWPSRQSDRAMLVLAALALVASLLYWWEFRLQHTSYPHHIVFLDNFGQARRALTQAIILQQKRDNGENVEWAEISGALDRASLKVRDCLSGRSTLSGLAGEEASGEMAALLKTYGESVARLDRNIRTLQRQPEQSEELLLQQHREFHQSEQIASAITTAQAQSLAATIDEQRLGQRIGLLCWFGFLGAAFWLFTRAAGIEAKQAGQEDLMQALLNSSSDAIIVKDLAGRYLLLNQPAATMTGKPASVLLGRDDRTVFPPDVAERLIAADRLVIESGVVSHYEEQLTANTGETLTFAVAKGVMRDRDGRAIGLYSISRDITAQRKETEALRYHRIMLQRTSRLAKVGGWEFDPKTGAGTWTEECARIYDLAPSAVVTIAEGLSCFEGEYRQQLEQAIQAAVTKGTPYDLELEMITATGQRKWVRSRCEPVMDSGQVVYVYGALQDISGRKQMEMSLRESEVRFRALFEQSLDAIGIMESYPPRFIVVNPAFVELFGYTCEEMQAMHGAAIWRLVHPEDRALVQNHFRDRIEGRADSLRYQFRIVRKDGAIRWVEVSGSITRVGDRMMNQSIYRDITQQKQAEEEQEKLRAQLLQAQKMESVGRLAGGVAHDFNNMLSVILGMVEIIEERLEPDTPLLGDLQEIKKAAQRSVDLTRQLLAFARKQTVMPKILDVNATVEGLLKMLRRLIGEDIQLVWAPAPSIGMVKIDPAQIDQVLANLCVNARDAINGTGKLTIETANVTIDTAYCGERLECEAGEYVMLAVSDDGCGMDRELMEHIFEPFFTTKAMGEGTGLGLATVYGIVRQNGGFVNVYSEPGQGTTFKIYLPRYGEDAPDEAAGGAETTGTDTRLTVLLVEDEPSLLELNERMLTRLGYTVLAATTPSRALELVRAHQGALDLLLTDVVMPEMNGRELAAKVRELAPAVKQLFMSGYTANVIAHHGVLDEGIFFLQKPFSKKNLASKIAEVMAS